MGSPLDYLGVGDATTTNKGKVRLATVTETTTGTASNIACTPLGVAAVAIAGSPDASTTTKGIIEIATDSEAVAKTSGLLAIVPSNIPDFMAAPGPIGSVTPSTGAFTTLTADTLVFTSALDVAEGGTGLTTITDHGIMLGSGTAAVTPLGVGTTGQLLVAATAADPAWATNIDLPGTLDVTGAATLDDALSVAGTGTVSGLFTCDASAVLDTAGAVSLDLGVNADTSAINIGLGAARTINVGTTAATVATINLGGTGANVIAVGATSTLGSLTLGNSGGGAVTVDSGAGISIDAATASNFTVTGAADLSLISTAGSIVVNAEEAVADAIQLQSAAGGLDVDVALQMRLVSSQAATTAIVIDASNAAGGIDVDCGSGGFIVDAAAGAISLDSALASNFTVTGAGLDLTLASSLGSVLVSSTEDAALAIRLHANAGTSETIQIHSDQGTGVASVDILSDVGGISLTATGLASDDAINLSAAAGGVDIDGAMQVSLVSSEATVDAILIDASNGAGGITMSSGSAGVAVTGDVVVTGALTTSGDFTLSSVATKMTMNGGAVTDFIGQGTLVAGTVTIANTNIATGDRIFVTRSALNASPALGDFITTISASTSFTVASYDAAGSLENTDVSGFDYFIIRQS